MNRENWNLLSINECADVIGGGTPSTKNSDYWDGNIPWISPKDLSNNKDKYITNGERFITELGLEKSSAKLLPANSLLFSSRAPIGYLAINAKPVATNQGFKSLILKDEFDVEFFYYLFKQKTEFIKSFASGSTFQEVSGSVVKNLSFLIPPKQEQEKISNILSKLDKKIELNQEMNENLEEIAKTLFKSWFIDFDPVRAKAEGRPTGLSKEISDLFPDSFEKSELGEMPSGWQTKNLGQILTFLGSGKRPKGGASVTDDQIPSIGAENINFIGNYDYSKEKYVPRNFYENLKEKGISIKDYDILIYKDGANIGRSTIFGKGFPHKDCTINEHAHLLRSERGIQKYLYFYLSTKQSQEYLISLNTASAQPGINQTQLKTLNILKPEKKILEKFDVLVAPIVDLIFLNCLANNNLSDIRDALLPKLISGELKISDAENLLKEADI